MTLKQHADAVLFNACCPMALDDFDPNTRQAILAALQTYGDERFNAGALAMREAAAADAEDSWREGVSPHDFARHVRNIDPAQIIKGLNQ